MSDTKFTPGPWVADTTDPSDVFKRGMMGVSGKRLKYEGTRSNANGSAS